MLHITSVSNQFGIGDLGPSAYQFIDFLKAAEQKLWQILPLGPTDYFGSPCPYSAFAGNIYLISPEQLHKDGLISEAELKSIDFGSAAAKHELITKAYANFQKLESTNIHSEYQSFYRANRFWLDDFALFMALKAKFTGVSWVNWPETIAVRKPDALASWRQKLKREIEQQIFAQFIFFRQWQQLKNYAHKKGIAIIGDLPLFVAHDSADVWAQPKLFLLDQRGMPEFVAGCLPIISANRSAVGQPL